MWLVMFIVFTLSNVQITFFNLFCSITKILILCGIIHINVSFISNFNLYSYLPPPPCHQCSSCQVKRAASEVTNDCGRKLLLSE